jgi:uncharacterized membrane protein YgdD (TMEM256/DUF423 family)
MGRKFVGIGAGLGFVGVALGAFGAHGLRGRVEEDLLAVWQTGVLYHLVHALALLLVALLLAQGSVKRIAWTAWLFVAGIAIFSGSLYAMTLTGIRAFGAITPIGGVCFLLGWLILCVAHLRSE